MPSPLVYTIYRGSGSSGSQVGRQFASLDEATRAADSYRMNFPDDPFFVDESEPGSQIAINVYYPRGGPGSGWIGSEDKPTRRGRCEYSSGSFALKRGQTHFACPGVGCSQIFRAEPHEISARRILLHPHKKG